MFKEPLNERLCLITQITFPHDENSIYRSHFFLDHIPQIQTTETLDKLGMTTDEFMRIPDHQHLP
jgi:hypothetical protein